jgi:hypothetical protein
MANKVSPDEYGLYVSSFILVTYSAFIVLGVNQALVKEHSKRKREKTQSLLILYSLFINLIGAGLTFAVVALVSTNEVSLFVASIASGKIIIECSATVHRVKEQLNHVNIIYLFNSIPLLSFYLFFDVENMADFFRIWGLSTLVAASFSIALLFKRALEIKQYLLPTVKFVKTKFIFLQKTGVQLAIIGFSTPFLASFDKLVLSHSAFDKGLLGSMQLADSFANAIVLGLGSIIFIITPKYIKKIHSKTLSIEVFKSSGYKILLVILLAVNVLIYLNHGLLIHFFPEYDLLYPLMLQVSTRTLMSGLFVINIITLAYSLEVQYLQMLLLVFGIYLVGLTLNMLLLQRSIWFYTIPLVNLGAVFLMHLMCLAYINKNVRDSS